jgi:hypothetical protein
MLGKVMAENLIRVDNKLFTQNTSTSLLKLADVSWGILYMLYTFLPLKIVDYKTYSSSD